MNKKHCRPCAILFAGESHQKHIKFQKNSFFSREIAKSEICIIEQTTTEFDDPLGFG